MANGVNAIYSLTAAYRIGRFVDRGSSLVALGWIGRNSDRQGGFSRYYWGVFDAESGAMSLAHRKRAALKVNFYTVVWGDWHTGILLDVNLPTLLAPGNMPAFVAQHDVTYTIFTTKTDAARIRQSPIFRAFSARTPTRLEAMPDRYFFGDTIDDFVNNHHRLWSRGLSASRKEQAMAGFLAPDLCWADGSFRHLANLVSAGKHSIFSAQMRICDDSFLADSLSRWTADDDGAVVIPPRELVRSLCDNMHPIIASYILGSPAPCFHYEHIIWPISGEGLLVRNLTCHGFLTSPARFELNEMHCPTILDSDEGLAFPTDSDDMFCVSLTQAMKDASWYFAGEQLDVFEIAGWWGSFDNPVHRRLARQDWLFHFSDGTDGSEWDRARGHAAEMCDRVLVADRLSRVWHILKAHDRTNASRFLSAYLHDCGDDLHGIPTEEIVVVVPSEDDLSCFPDWYINAIIQDRKEGPDSAVLNGIFTMLTNSDSRTIEAGTLLRSKDGQIVEVQSARGQTMIGEFAIEGMESTAAGDVVCFAAPAEGA